MGKGGQLAALGVKRHKSQGCGVTLAQEPV